MRRDLAVGRGDWLALDGGDDTDGDPPAPVTFDVAEVTVDAPVLRVDGLCHRHYQAARIATGEWAVTVAARHCPLDGVHLAPISDIEPYLTGYQRIFERIGRRPR